MTILLGAACAMILAQATQAIPINGVIDISGTAVLDNTLGSATKVTGFAGTAVDFLTQTGAFLGTDGDAVTMHTFGWNPVSLPTNPLWKFTDSTTGWTYSFDLSSLSVEKQTANFLNITGDGSLSITGTGSPYSTTDGSWSFTISSSTTSEKFAFGFDSETSSVPDGGATVALLGSAMVGLSMLRRKLGA